MKVEYKKKGDKKESFVVYGINYTLANAIRRSVMTHVPSMAIDRVTVYENTSILYEEMIAQRLGLIPLTTDLKTYKIPDEKYKKGDATYECALILEKEGPSTVYSGDLKSRDPKIKPVHDKIPIVKLAENQKVKMEMSARLGFMGEHAKFQSSISSYKQLNDSDFEFFVESYNNLSAREITELGLENLEAKIGELEDAFSGKKTKKATKK
jgi:DNA-directed RNA polymerase subunit D